MKNPVLSFDNPGLSFFLNLGEKKKSADTQRSRAALRFFVYRCAKLTINIPPNFGISKKKFF
jgi:hypothetical protein